MQAMRVDACPVMDLDTALQELKVEGSRPSDVVARTPRNLRPKLVLVAADSLAVVLSAAMAVTWYRAVNPEPGVAASHLWWVTLASLPLWLMVLAHQRLYNSRFIERRIDEFRRIVNASVLGTWAVILAAMAGNVLLPRSGLIMLAACACVTFTVERNVARRLFRGMRSRGQMLRQVVIVGANHEARDIAAMLRAEPWLGYEVVGFVSDDEGASDEPVPGLRVLGGLDDLPRLLGEIDRASVIVATSAVPSATTNRLARDLLEIGIYVELSSSLRDIAPSRLTVRPLGRFPVVYLEPRRRSGWRAKAKRTFDFAGAAFGLLAAAPVLAATALAIKLDSRGTVLFKQQRVGQNGVPFDVLKLRSMCNDAEDRLIDLRDQNEADGPLFKMADDPRVTRVGKFIRKASIDEIPQLWNVLRGDMSLVGPRPALPHESEEWDNLLKHRLRVKPGITGMWQVSGRSDTSFDDYTRLDLYYVDNWSLTTDLAILAKTVPVVAFGTGAH
jgi:exopolysaccharide biosynthesis polyprenyl glycosylphosphotransferase